MKPLKILIAILILSALVLIGVLINKSATGKPVYLELGIKWNIPLLICLIGLVVILFLISKGGKQNEKKQRRKAK